MAIAHSSKPINWTGASFVAVSIKENIFHLGMLLLENISLPYALRELCVFSGNERIKRAARNAAERLAAGENCEKVFASSEMTAFGSFARYILASPMPDKTKGLLLASWKYKSGSAFEALSGLSYCFQSLIIGLFSILTLLMFVIPQFIEIMRSFPDPAVEPFSLKVLALFADPLATILFLGVFFIIFISAVVLLLRRVFRVREIVDEINLLKLLKVVPIHEKCDVLEIMARPHNFPLLHRSFKILASEYRASGDIVTATEKAGCSNLISWFMHLTMTEDVDDQVIAQGVTLLETTYATSMSRAITITEIVCIAGQGLIFGLFAYIVFQSLIMIMLGTMA